VRGSKLTSSQELARPSVLLDAAGERFVRCCAGFYVIGRRSATALVVATWTTSLAPRPQDRNSPSKPSDRQDCRSARRRSRSRPESQTKPLKQLPALQAATRPAGAF